MSQNITISSDTIDPSQEGPIQNCKKCDLPIYEGHAYELGDDRWHINCFKCSKCNSSLGCNSNFLVLGNGNLICSNCSYSCKQCGKKIDDLAILTGDQAYCSSCFKCRACKQKIEDLRYARTSKGLFCMNCHEKLIAKKRKYDLKKKHLEMLKEREREKENLMSKNIPGSNPSSNAGSAVSTPNLDDDERPLHQPRHITHPTQNLTSSFQSSNEVYDLYDQSRSPTPKLNPKNASTHELWKEITRSSSALSKDKELPSTPILNDTTNTVGSTTESHGFRKSLDPNNSQHDLSLSNVVHPQPRKPMEREFSIEEINDSDDELNRRTGNATPPITIQHVPTTPPRSSDFLQPAVNLNHDKAPTSPASVSHTKFQGKNLLILSPSQQYHNLDNSSIRLPRSPDSNLHVENDLRSRSNCPSPMAKANRHARVLEDNDRLYHDADRTSDDDTLQSSLPEPDFSTPKKKTPSSSNNILSPPPKLPLPSVPPATSGSNYSTPKEDKLSVSDQYYVDAITNANDDFLNGLGLEGVEYNDFNDTNKVNDNNKPKTTPAVTNLENEYDKNSNVNGNGSSSVHGTPEQLGRKQSIIRTPRLGGLRHKRSTSGGSSTGIKINFFKKEDKGHSRHISDGSINNSFTSFITPPIFNPNQHTRSSSDTSGAPTITGNSNQLQEYEKSIKLEINHLEGTKKNLMTDVRKLQDDRTKLNNEIDQLKLKYAEELKKLNSLSKEVNELKIHKSNIDKTMERPVEKSGEEITTNHNSNSSSSLINTPDMIDDQIETQKATKLKFWRRAKIGFNNVNIVPSNGISGSLSNNNLLAPLSNNSLQTSLHKDGSAMSKSRSTHLLDSFLGGNNSGSSTSNDEDNAPLFQSSIERRCKFENSEIPLIVARCLKEVETRGLDLEGIYRISGGNLTIQSIELAFSNINPKLKDDKSMNKLEDILDCDINAVTSALKRYLRKIPDPLIPYDLYTEFIKLTSTSDTIRRISEFKFKVIDKLPMANKSVLLELCKHLELIDSFSSVNRMNFKNLSVVFAPTIARDQTGQREMMDMGHRNDITEFLFVHYKQIFY